MGEQVHQYPRATSARILAAAFDIVVGLRLLLPDDILGTNPGYRLMADHFGADWALGLALLLLGAVMVVSMLSDRWQPFVSAATWLALLTWLVVAIDILIVNVSTLGTLVYVLVAALHGFAYFHMRAWQRQQRRAAGN